MTTTWVVAGLAAAGLGNAAYAAEPPSAVQQLSNAKISLPEAVHMAEREGDGKATAVGFRPERKGSGWYEVTVLRIDGRRLTRYRLDAGSGRIIEASNEPIRRALTRVTPQQIADAGTSLTSAIDMAEQRTGGRALEAAVEHRHGEVSYEVRVTRLDGATERVQIEAATGHLASAE